MLDLVSEFSNKNQGKFNDDLILNMRQKDEMTEYIDAACRAVAMLIPEYIEYKGYHYQDSRAKMLDRDKDAGDAKVKKGEIYLNINETYAKEAIFDFECIFNGERTKQSFAMWIPMIVDNSHFLIRGNKYSCPLQVIDALTFTKKNVLVFKTTTRAIKFERTKVAITDIYGNKYNTSKINIYFTSKGVPLLMYFFAAFGFFKTIKYFGADEYIKIYSDSKEDKRIPEDKYIFKFGSVFLGVNKKEFNENNILRMFVATILACSKRSMDMDFIRNPVRWTSFLGESINVQKSLEKGQALLKTFVNTMDFQTIKIMRELVPGTERTNIFSVTRWIFINYATLTAKDEGLQNKRLRLSEYLISPFIKVFTEKVYRFKNTPDKLKSMKGLMDIFKIKSSLILNSIIGKISHADTGLTIAKFSNECNDDALINTLLYVTKTGPGSPSAKSKRLSMHLRMFSVDYLGCLDLTAGQSANAPGLTHFICPLNDNFDEKRKIFNIDSRLIKK